MTERKYVPTTISAPHPRLPLPDSLTTGVDVLPLHARPPVRDEASLRQRRGEFLFLPAITTPTTPPTKYDIHILESFSSAPLLYTKTITKTSCCRNKSWMPRSPRPAL